MPVAATEADNPRASFYRLFFALAAAYNVAFAAWAIAWPRGFFDLFAMDAPRYPAIWRCLGMVVGVYGLGCAYAALRLDRAHPFIALGLLGKTLGPIGWVATVHGGE
ncbi:MAG: alkyl hydroperoxide reductase [Acidobacteria bacterium]|nr:MAG: alkyl hydroperoxide reductase [Acidobacteriota bacterium]